MANTKNALEQLTDTLASGAKALFGVTPVGQAYNAATKAVQTFQSPQARQQISEPIVNTSKFISQHLNEAPIKAVVPKFNAQLANLRAKYQDLSDQLKFNQVNITGPNKFLTDLENRQDIPSQIFVKPLASGAKTLGAALIQAPTLALTGGKVNPQFWTDQEMQKFASGDTMGERALKAGKQYLSTVPEAGLELYSLGGGAAVKGGLKAVAQQTMKGLMNVGLGSLISDGAKVIENIRSGKPIADGLKESTVQGATSSYYIPLFNAASEALISKVLPNLATSVAAKVGPGGVQNAARWVAEQLPRLGEENLGQFSQKAWDIVRDTSVSSALRRKVFFWVLSKEVAKGILEAPVQGAGFGLLDYVKGNAPLRDALANNIASSLIMNPLFRSVTSAGGAGAKQVWFGPTGELNSEAGKGVQYAIWRGSQRFLGVLAQHMHDPKNQAGFINFGADIGPQTTNMSDAELGRLSLIQRIQAAEDKGSIGTANALKKELEALDAKSVNQTVSQPVEPLKTEAVQSPITPQTDLLGNPIPEKAPSIKPEQQSMIPEIGTGKTTPEEMQRTVDRMVTEKRAGTAGIEGTPLGNEVQKATLQEQMGPGLIPETPVEKPKLEVLTDHITSLEDSIRGKFGDAAVENIQKKATQRNLSVVDYVNSLREYAARKKLEIPTLTGGEAKAVVDEVVRKPREEWTKNDVNTVAEYLGVKPELVKEFDDPTVRKLFQIEANKPLSVTDQQVVTNIENSMRDAIYAKDDTTLLALEEARKNAVDSAKAAGLDVQVTPTENLKAEVETAMAGEVKQAEKAVINEGVGALTEVNQYAKIIRDAVRTWQMWRSKGKFEDIAALTLRFPGLDEAVEAIRNVTGVNPQIEDLAKIRFPKGTVEKNGPRLRVTTAENIPNTVDDINRVQQIAADRKVTTDQTNQELARLDGKFMQDNPQNNPITTPIVAAKEGTVPQKELPSPTEQRRLPVGKPSEPPPPPKNVGARDGNSVLDELGVMAEEVRKDKLVKSKESHSFKKIYNKFMEGLVNKYQNFGDIATEYKKKTGKELPAMSDPQKLAELIAGVPNKISNLIQNNYIDPILTTAKKAGVDKYLSQYLMLRRFIQNVQYVSMQAEDLLASGDMGMIKEGRQMLDRAAKGEVNPRKINIAEANRGLEALKAKLSPEQWQLVEDLANKTYAFNEGILDMAGNVYKVIPQDTYLKLKERVKGYVPEFVEKYFQNTDLSAMGTGSFDKEFQKYLYRFSGTMENIEDPLVTTMKKAIYLVKYGEEQKVYNALVDSLGAIGKAQELKPGVRPAGSVTHTAEIDVKTMGKIQALMDNLGIKYETKIGVGGKNRLGYYSPFEDKIYRKFGTSPLTLVHEIGHNIDQRYGLSDIFINKPKASARAIRILINIMEGKVKGVNWTQGPEALPIPTEKKVQMEEALKLYNTVQKELRNLADLRQVQKAYGRKASEKIATLFAWSALNPEETQKVAPNAFKIFNKFIETNPEIKPIMDLRAPSLVQGQEKWTSPVFIKTKPKAPAVEVPEGAITAPEGMKVLTVNRDGKFKYYAIPEDMYRVASYLTNSTNAINPIFNMFLSGPKTLLRKGATTWALSFAVPNLVRDQKRFLTLSKYGFTSPEMIVNYPFSLVRGLVSAAKATFGKEDSLYESFINSKAGSSTFQKFMTPEGFVKAFEKQSPAETWRQKLAAFHVMEKMNNIFEETTKLTAYRQGLIKESPEAFRSKGLIKMGLNMDKVNPDILDGLAWEVRNYGGSPDFAKMGVNGKELNLLFMFFNARLQGVVSDMSRFKQDPGSTMARQAVMAVLPTVGLYYWNQLRAPDARDNVPDYVKDNYFVLYTGRSQYNPDTGKLDYEYLSLPKNDWDKIFGNTVDYTFDYIRKKDPEAFKEIALNLFGTLSPFTFTPKAGVPALQSLASGVASSINPAIGLPLEMITNYDFFKQQAIVSDKLKKQIPPNQYYDYTTAMAKQLANFFTNSGMSPVMIDHIASRVGGSLMTDLFRLASTALFGQEFQARYAPILKRFYGWAGGQTDKDLSTQMYDKLSSLGQVYTTWKQKIKDGKMEEAQYIYDQVPQVAYYTKLQQYANNISELRNNGDAIRNNPNYTDEQKQTYTLAIDKNIMDMIDQLNKLVGEPGGVKLMDEKKGVQAAESTPQNRNLFPSAEAASQTVGPGSPYKPLDIKPITPTTDKMGTPRISFKAPNPTDTLEQLETDKQAIPIPDVMQPEDQPMFEAQFATLTDTMTDMQSRIKSLTVDRDHPYEVRKDYIAAYQNKIDQIRQMRYEYAQMYPEYWQSYLQSDDGTSWLKKEATAYYKALGVKTPAWVNNLGKPAGTGVKKATVKAPSVSLKKVTAPKVSTPKIKLKGTSIKIPKYKISGAKVSSPKMPKLRSIKPTRVSISGKKFKF